MAKGKRKITEELINSAKKVQIDEDSTSISVDKMKFNLLDLTGEEVEILANYFKQKTDSMAKYIAVLKDPNSSKTEIKDAILKLEEYE